jgi:hypothetical protein
VSCAGTTTLQMFAATPPFRCRGAPASVGSSTCQVSAVQTKHTATMNVVQSDSRLPWKPAWCSQTAGCHGNPRHGVQEPTPLRSSLEMEKSTLIHPHPSSSILILTIIISCTSSLALRPQKHINLECDHSGELCSDLVVRSFTMYNGQRGRLLQPHEWAHRRPAAEDLDQALVGMLHGIIGNCLQYRLRKCLFLLAVNHHKGRQVCSSPQECTILTAFHWVRTQRARPERKKINMPILLQHSWLQ